MNRCVPLLLCLGLCAGSLRAEVVINEIMYNTPGFPDVEYVELINTGAQPADLTGWFLIDDDDAHDPCPLSGTLAPGAYLVVAGDLGDFQTVYPGVIAVNPLDFGSNAPSGGFSLGNTTDIVRLFDDADDLVDRVPYTDTPPWPPAPDGTGPSLELLNPALDNELPENWAASLNGPPKGTPGAQNSTFVSDLPPTIDYVRRDVALPGPTDPVVVTASVVDGEGLASVELFVDDGAGFAATPMADDATGGDSAAGDGVFAATLAPRPDGTLVRYYVRGTDDAAQQATAPAAAPAEFFAYTVGYMPPPLQVAEILASNQNGVFDGFGERDDWIEIRNRGPQIVDIEGMYLSDDRDEPRLWPLPSIQLGGGGRLLIWADGQPEQGARHASFRLSRAGGEIDLYDTVEHGNVRIHGFTFGPQSADVSFGFAPESADAPEYLASPTPVADNLSSPLHSAVCINEFLSASQLPGVPDWVELYNRGTAAADIGGWYLSDDPALPGKFAIAPGTILLPGERLSIDGNALGFGLAAAGETVVLTAADGETGQDYIDYGPQFPDTSFGRYPEGTPNWHAFSPATRDAANHCDLGIAPLAPVENLRFEPTGEWSWDALDGTAAYDVLRGDLDTLRATGGAFGVAVDGCAANNVAETRAWDATPGPAGFYLVRGVNFSCAFGTWDSSGIAQAAGRDTAIDSSGAACP